MDPIQSLKQRAANKRDKAIQAAKAEYRATIRQLDDLAAGLPERYRTPPAPLARRTRATRGIRRPRLPRSKSVTQLILETMPKDRHFTSREMLELLERANPGQSFGEPTIRTIFYRLMHLGMVQKVCKARRGCILWAATECPVADYGPFATFSMQQIICAVLKEKGPLRPVDAVVAIQERGYRPDADRRILLQMVSQAFKRNRDRFVLQTDGRWSSV